MGQALFPVAATDFRTPLDHESDSCSWCVAAPIDGMLIFNATASAARCPSAPAQLFKWTQGTKWLQRSTLRCIRLQSWRLPLKETPSFAAAARLVRVERDNAKDLLIQGRSYGGGLDKLESTELADTTSLEMLLQGRGPCCP